jgi:hypothetical protein
LAGLVRRRVLRDTFRVNPVSTSRDFGERKSRLANLGWHFNPRVGSSTRGWHLQDLESRLPLANDSVDYPLIVAGSEPIHIRHFIPQEISSHQLVRLVVFFLFPCDSMCLSDTTQPMHSKSFPRGQVSTSTKSRPMCRFCARCGHVVHAKTIIGKRSPVVGSLCIGIYWCKLRVRMVFFQGFRGYVLNRRSRVTSGIETSHSTLPIRDFRWPAAPNRGNFISHVKYFTSNVIRLARPENHDQTRPLFKSLR